MYNHPQGNDNSCAGYPPTTGGAYPPGAGYPAAPGAGYPGTGYPAAPGAGYPGTGYPGTGYPAAPGAGYPAAPGAGYPAAPGAGYPAAAPGAGYPAAAPGAGYPAAAPGAGYPAASGAGYPTAPGAGYPAASGAGYPAASGAGYPAAPGAGYPAASGLGFPAAAGPGYSATGPGAGYPAAGPGAGYPAATPGAGHGGFSVKMSKPLRKAGPTNDFSADAAKLYKAFKGIGCNEKKCFDILCKRSIAQVKKISECYKNIYAKDLVQRIKSETSGVIERFMVCLVLDQAGIDAYWILYSIKGLGTDDTCLVHMMTTNTTEQLQAASQAFKRDFGKDMACEIKDDTSGTYMKFLLARIHSKPRLPNAVDTSQLPTQIEIIKNKFRGVGSSSDFVIDLLTTFSEEHIRALNKQLLDTTRQTLTEILNASFSGWFLTAIVTYVSFCLDRISLFANILKNAISVDDHLTIARVLTTRGEIDLGSILEAYDMSSQVKFAAALQTKPSSTFYNAVKLFVS